MVSRGICALAAEPPAVIERCRMNFRRQGSGMSSKREKFNWERFRNDWAENRIIVNVDPYKAMQAWKDGITHSAAPAVWFAGALCIPGGFFLSPLYSWWWAALGFIAFLALHFCSQRMHAKAVTKAMLEDESVYRLAMTNSWVRITRV